MGDGCCHPFPSMKQKKGATYSCPWMMNLPVCLNVKTLIKSWQTLLTLLALVSATILKVVYLDHFQSRPCYVLFHTYSWPDWVLAWFHFSFFDGFSWCLLTTKGLFQLAFHNCFICYLALMCFVFLFLNLFPALFLNLFPALLNFAFNWRWSN